MTILLPKPSAPNFRGFGPSLLDQVTRGELQRHPIPDSLVDARTMLHDHCPLTPGVYGWLDSRQQICYIGKSKSLRTRLLTYFAKNPSDKKAFRIRQHGYSLVWEPLTDELLSLIREQELIYRWRPEFNTQGQPTKRQPAFLCFSKGLAPNAYFTRRVSDKASLSFGPISGTGRLRNAIESINQVFLLRDCPDKTGFEFNDQQQLFENARTAGCIRHELGSCPAPCAGHCSKKQYFENVDAAIKFVRGNDTAVLKRVHQQMESASAEQCFERAVVLRDHYKNLAWLDRRMKSLRSAERNFNGIFPVPTVMKETAWMILRKGRLVGTLPAPRNSEEAIEAIKLLSNISSERERMPRNILEMNLQLIMISWFRKHRGLKKKILPFKQAIEHCETVMASGSPKLNS